MSAPTLAKLHRGFRPKTGKNKHWYYKHIDTLTQLEIRKLNLYGKLFMIQVIKNEKINNPRHCEEARRGNPKNNT